MAFPPEEYSSYRVVEVDCPDCRRGRCRRCYGSGRLRVAGLAGHPVELPPQSMATIERDVVEVTRLSWMDMEERLAALQIKVAHHEDLRSGERLLWACGLLSAVTLGLLAVFA